MLISVFKSHNGKIELMQPFLTQRIIDTLGDAVKSANIKKTPAETRQVLHKDDVDGPERKQQWHYASVIGMLMYLTGTRPDILYAVHSCAQFIANPKLIHEQAVKCICRYLKGTAPDKGITILDQIPSRGIECYVDAGFAGDYSQANRTEPSSVLLRTGYVIFYHGCPVVWVSKKQSELALSTTEAEYIALSQAMRDVIPFVELIGELKDHLNLEIEKPEIACTLFEDNNGALELANAPKYRPRMKHIALKYHHFREHVRRGLCRIIIQKNKLQINLQKL